MTLQSDCFAYFAYSAHLSLQGSAGFRDCTAGLRLCSEFHEQPNPVPPRCTDFVRDRFVTADFERNFSYSAPAE